MGLLLVMLTLFLLPWFPRSSKTPSAPDSYAASLLCITPPLLFICLNFFFAPLHYSLPTSQSVFYSMCSLLLWPLLALLLLISGVTRILVTADAGSWTTPICFYCVHHSLHTQFICPCRLPIFFSHHSSPPSLSPGYNREHTHSGEEAFCEKVGFVAYLEDSQSKTHN